MKQYLHLLDQFSPNAYTIDLLVDPKRDTIDVSTVISGTALKDGTIQLHAKDLVIDEISVNESSASWKFKEDDILELTSSAILKNTDIDIKCSGQADIQSGLHGAYRSPGGDGDIISTQMESHHARELFPCIDEPAAKAVFTVNITSPSDQTVLSNGKLTDSKKAGDMLRHEFEPTPKMSSYLFAFVVGKLEKLTAQTARGIEVSTYAVTGREQHTAFALETAVACLDFYEEYFGIEYPLSKCDMVAIPEFSAGAMENWGLVTYRESALLYDPETTSLSSKQWVALVVAHELAHQWFGNLVTMRWWTDLWLNEGFASWVEYLAVDHIFPEWKMWHDFTSSDVNRAMALDSLDNSHPIEVPIDNPDEIRSIFDAISYSKGATVIHMLANYLGHETFQKGLQLYLNKHSYSNTDTVDLWAALSETSGQNIEEFMASWTKETGFPLVTLAGKKATQQRFYLLDPAKKDQTVWNIPLQSSSETGLLSSQSEDISSNDSIYNLNGATMAVFSFDEPRLNSLEKRIKDKKLSDEHTANVIDNQLILARSGNGSIASILKIISDINEPKYYTAGSIGSVIGSTRKVFDSEIQTAALRILADRISGKGFAELRDSTSSDHFTQLLRTELHSLQSFAQTESFIGYARKTYLENPVLEKIDPQIRGSVLSSVVRNGDEAEFEHLIESMKETKNPQFSVQLIGQISSFSHPELIKRSIKLIMDDSSKLQETPYWIAYHAMNKDAKQQIWDWITGNWEWISEKFGSDIMTIAELPKYAANCFIGDQALDDALYLPFFESTPEYSQIKRQILQGQEAIRIAQNWRAHDLSSLDSFIEKQL